MWYKEIEVNLGYRIDMVNKDFGYAISRGKGDINGKVYTYKNNNWTPFTSFSYSDYPSIIHLSDSSFLYLIHETHFGKYRPRLIKVERGKKEEFSLPPVMWDERDFTMWKGLSVINKDEFWLAGQKGNIIKYKNNRWLKEFVADLNSNSDNFLSNDINDIFMLSDTLGWAVTRSGSGHDNLSSY